MKAVPRQDPPPDVSDKVKVRNNSRRSLLVKVPGQAIHLQPGTSAEVPRAFLNTDELAALLRSGAVLLATPPGARAVSPAEAPAVVPDEPSAPRPPRKPK